MRHEGAFPRKLASMHRLKTLIASLALVVPIAIVACGGGKKPAKTSHDDSSSSSEDAGTEDNSAFGGGNQSSDGGGNECTGFDEPKLDEALMKIIPRNSR